MPDEPTNADIMRKLDEFGHTQAAHTTAIESVSARVLDLEKWQIAFKAADEALSKANLRNPGRADGQVTNDINRDLLALMTKIIGVVATLGSIIYIIVNKGSL